MLTEKQLSDIVALARKDKSNPPPQDVLGYAIAFRYGRVLFIELKGKPVFILERDWYWATCTERV